MEEKIISILDKMNTRFDEITKEVHDLKKECNAKFDAIIERQTAFEKECNKKFDTIFEQQTTFNTKIDEILGQQFVFEHEYGTKIDAIFDAVTLELDKNLEKSKKIRRLDNRMDMAEANIFNHEKRISKIELNQ